MERGCPFEVERAVVFRKSVFSIGLFAHFHIRDGITAFFKVSDLGNGVFGIVVDHGHRNHRREPARDAAGIEKIEADVITPVVDDGAFMPWVDGGTDGVALRTIGRVRTTSWKAPSGVSVPM